MGDVCNACMIERLASAELGDTAAGEASALRASFIIFGTLSLLLYSLRAWESWGLDSLTQGCGCGSGSVRC